METQNQDSLGENKAAPGAHPGPGQQAAPQTRPRGGQAWGGPAGAAPGAPHRVPPHPPTLGSAHRGGEEPSRCPSPQPGMANDSPWGRTARHGPSNGLGAGRPQSW